MYLFFLKTLFGLIIVVLFFVFSFYILSLFTRRHVFLNCFRLHGLFKKNVFLVCWSFKRNVPLCFLFLLVFFLLKKMQNDNLFYLFLNFFFELFTFSTQTLSEKLHVLCFSVSSYFQFFFHLFFHVVFCLIFLDLLRNMLPFKSVFFTSLFPLFVHPLSICSLFCLLLCSRFFHLFSLFKLPFFWVFLLSLCSLCQTLCGKIFLNFCETIFLLFTTKKLRFFCFLFSWVFSCFSMFGLFLCLEK